MNGIGASLTPDYRDKEESNNKYEIGFLELYNGYEDIDRNNFLKLKEGRTTSLIALVKGQYKRNSFSLRMN